MKQLGIEPIKQKAWHLQIKDEIKISKRIIDEMSIAQIRKMYLDKKFICDVCGGSLGKIDFSLEEHVIHMINAGIIWSCDDCIIKDIKNGRVLGMTETKAKKWQSNNI
jgi:hypothetical protein